MELRKGADGDSEDFLRAELARLQNEQAREKSAEEGLLEKLQATIELEISMAVSGRSFEFANFGHVFPNLKAMSNRFARVRVRVQR